MDTHSIIFNTIDSSESNAQEHHIMNSQHSFSDPTVVNPQYHGKVYFSRKYNGLKGNFIFVEKPGPLPWEQIEKLDNYFVPMDKPGCQLKTFFNSEGNPIIPIENANYDKEVEYRSSINVPLEPIDCPSESLVIDLPPWNLALAEKPVWLNTKGEQCKVAAHIAEFANNIAPDCSDMLLQGQYQCQMRGCDGALMSKRRLQSLRRRFLELMTDLLTGNPPHHAISPVQAENIWKSLRSTATKTLQVLIENKASALSKTMINLTASTSQSPIRQRSTNSSRTSNGGISNNNKQFNANSTTKNNGASATLSSTTAIYNRALKEVRTCLGLPSNWSTGIAPPSTPRQQPQTRDVSKIKSVKPFPPQGLSLNPQQSSVVSTSSARSSLSLNNKHEKMIDTSSDKNDEITTTTKTHLGSADSDQLYFVEFAIALNALGAVPFEFCVPPSADSRIPPKPTSQFELRNYWAIEQLVACGELRELFVSLLLADEFDLMNLYSRNCQGMGNALVKKSEFIRTLCMTPFNHPEFPFFSFDVPNILSKLLPENHAVASCAPKTFISTIATVPSATLIQSSTCESAVKFVAPMLAATLSAVRTRSRLTSTLPLIRPPLQLAEPAVFDIFWSHLVTTEELQLLLAVHNRACDLPPIHTIIPNKPETSNCQFKRRLRTLMDGGKAPLHAQLLSEDELSNIGEGMLLDGGEFVPDLSKGHVWIPSQWIVAAARHICAVAANYFTEEEWQVLIDGRMPEDFLMKQTDSETGDVHLVPQCERTASSFEIAVGEQPSTTVCFLISALVRASDIYLECIASELGPEEEEEDIHFNKNSGELNNDDSMLKKVLSQKKSHENVQSSDTNDKYSHESDEIQAPLLSSDPTTSAILSNNDNLHENKKNNKNNNVVSLSFQTPMPLSPSPSHDLIYSHSSIEQRNNNVSHTSSAIQLHGGEQNSKVDNSSSNQFQYHEPSIQSVMCNNLNEGKINISNLTEDGIHHKNDNEDSILAIDRPIVDVECESNSSKIEDHVCIQHHHHHHHTKTHIVLNNGQSYDDIVHSTISGVSDVGMFQNFDNSIINSRDFGECSYSAKRAADHTPTAISSGIALINDNNTIDDVIFPSSPSPKQTDFLNGEKDNINNSVMLKYYNRSRLEGEHDEVRGTLNGLHVEFQSESQQLANGIPIYENQDKGNSTQKEQLQNRNFSTATSPIFADGSPVHHELLRFATLPVSLAGNDQQSPPFYTYNTRNPDESPQISVTRRSEHQSSVNVSPRILLPPPLTVTLIAAASPSGAIHNYGMNHPGFTKDALNLSPVSPQFGIPEPANEFHLSDSQHITDENGRNILRKENNPSFCYDKNSSNTLVGLTDVSTVSNTSKHATPR